MHIVYCLVTSVLLCTTVSIHAQPLVAALGEYTQAVTSLTKTLEKSISKTTVLTVTESSSFAAFSSYYEGNDKRYLYKDSKTGYTKLVPYVKSIAWSPDGKQLAVGYIGSIIKIVNVDMNTIQEEKTIDMKSFLEWSNKKLNNDTNNEVLSLSWRADSKQLRFIWEYKNEEIEELNNTITITKNHDLVSYDLTNNKIQSTLKVSDYSALALSNPSTNYNNHVALIAHDAQKKQNHYYVEIRYGDSKKGRTSLDHLGTANAKNDHKGDVVSIAWSPNGTQIASGSEDKTIKIWSLAGYIEHTLQGHTGVVTALAFSPDGNRIVSGANNGEIKIWDIKKEKCIRTLQGDKKKIISVTYLDNDNYIAAADLSKIRIWDTSAYALHSTVTTPNNHNHIAWNQHTMQFAIAENQLVKIYTINKH